MVTCRAANAYTASTGTVGKIAAARNGPGLAASVLVKSDSEKRPPLCDPSLRTEPGGKPTRRWSPHKRQAARGGTMPVPLGGGYCSSLAHRLAAARTRRRDASMLLPRREREVLCAVAFGRA